MVGRGYYLKPTKAVSKIGDLIIVGKWLGKSTQGDKIKNPNSLIISYSGFFFCGADGTRTRDPRRDRPVF